MTPAAGTAKRTTKGTKSAPSSAKQPSDQAKQPARKRTQSASKAGQAAPAPVKLVRKGRKPTAGARLAREMAGVKDSFERKTLIAQAARLADRLEVLARLLDGDPGAWLAVKVAGQVATVVVTDVVREERQLSEVLRKLMMDIQKLGGDVDPKSAGPKVDRLAEIVAGHYGGRKRA